MKVPRDLGGRELIRLLCRDWGYTEIHQEGSHVVLETGTPNHQRISIPAHKVLRIGTLNNILRAVARHKGVSKEALLEKR
ncbi:MAG: type II toxin-antitoxin system HicA family toxin [Planctomycetota bacterium]